MKKGPGCPGPFCVKLPNELFVAGALQVEGRRAVHGVDEVIDALIERGRFLGVRLSYLRAHFVLECLHLVHAGIHVAAVEGIASSLEAGNEWPLVFATQIGIVDQCNASLNTIAWSDNADVFVAAARAAIAVTDDKRDSVATGLETNVYDCTGPNGDVVDYPHVGEGVAVGISRA